MSEREFSDQELMEAFQSRSINQTEEPALLAERIFDAVSGELDEQSTREVIERTARDPEAAEVWRLAVELQRERAGSDHLGSRKGATVASFPQEPERGSGSQQRYAWLAVAAAVLIAALLGLFIVRGPRTQDDTVRGGGESTVVPLIEEDQALPRSDFVLRWRPVEGATGYNLTVATESVDVLYEQLGITGEELLVPARALASVADGGRVVWRVEAMLESGGRKTSNAFIARVEGPQP